LLFNNICSSAKQSQYEGPRKRNWNVNTGEIDPVESTRNEDERRVVAGSNYKIAMRDMEGSYVLINERKRRATVFTREQQDDEHEEGIDHTR
jgi:hypothetical protein